MEAIKPGILVSVPEPAVAARRPRGALSSRESGPVLQQRISLAEYREIISRSGGSIKPLKRKTEEEDLHRECIALVALMRSKHPILRWLHHSPNGGKRSRGEAGKMKAMGTKPGFPDLVLPRRCGQWAGLAIELKSRTGRVSADQQEWLEAFREDGYLVAVCRRLEEFEGNLRVFLSH